MNIVIPMAGRGTRLSGHSSGLPKPLISVAGKPLWAWASGCLPIESATRVVFVALREMDRLYSIRASISATSGLESAEVILLDAPTDGQLRTVMEARGVLDPDVPTVVFNADTWFDHEEAVFAQLLSEHAGVLGVSNRRGDQWSFVELDAGGRVTRVVEKERISDVVCTGLYAFRDTRALFLDADEMFRRGLTSAGEFFVAPLYDLMLARGESVSVCTAREFAPLGTPEELAEFEDLVRSRGLGAAGESASTA